MTASSPKRAPFLGWVQHPGLAHEPFGQAQEAAAKVRQARIVVERLTDPERTVLQALVDGESPRVAAERVEGHAGHGDAVLEAIMHKLGARGTADAVRIGIYAGLGTV